MADAARPDCHPPSRTAPISVPDFHTPSVGLRPTPSPAKLEKGSTAPALARTFALRRLRRFSARRYRRSRPIMNALTAFLGGSPAGVALRLIVVSFIVGIVLVTFGFDPGRHHRQFRQRDPPPDRLRPDRCAPDRPSAGDRRAGGAAGVAGAQALGRAPGALSAQPAAAHSRARAPTRALRSPLSPTAFARPSRISPIRAGPR